jgi:hypothetical protein
MDYKSGEIYFVRESTENGFSSFVKIGLVHGVRDSLTRLKEHQTGNPRKLYINEEQVVKTEAVDLVEAQMHKIFSPKRVSGEWFDFQTEEELSAAVTAAEALAKEIGSLMPVFKEAHELSSKTSDEPVVQPSNEALSLSKAIATAQGELDVCKTLTESIKSKMRAAIEDEKGEVKGGAELVTKTYAPKFMLEAFKENNPELFEKYVEMVQGWNPKFSPTAKKLKREELGPDFLEQIEGIEQHINDVDSVAEAYRLIEPQLLLTKLTARSKWDLDISLAKLKVLCGRHSGIEGVCTWNRQFSDPKPMFNEKLFVEENPELYVDFLAEAKTGTYLRVAKRKA